MRDIRQQELSEAVTKFLTVARQWASQRPDITAVALAGSHAHGRAREDSDIDVVFLSDTPDPLRLPSWLDAFGKVTSLSTEQWGILTAHRVRYEEHGEVEVGVAPTSWADVPADAGTDRVVSDGIVVVFDPHKKLDALISWVRENVS